MANKRIRRSVSRDQPEKPRYPTLERFDGESRRQALQRLGAAVLGLGSLGALAACGDRALQTDSGPPDRWPINEGAAPAPDARIDQQVERSIDRGPTISDGVAPAPDARLDKLSVPEGAAPMPDARLDGIEGDGLTWEDGGPNGDGGANGDGFSSLD